jgi:ethanolamine utilization protein EutL
MFHGVLDPQPGKLVFALFENKKLLHQAECIMQPRDASQMPDFVAAQLAECGMTLADVTRWSFGAGPGSFTFLRVAAALGAGWAAGNDRIRFRCLPGAPALAKALGAPEGYPCMGMLTTDCDDATYIALDEATKTANVQVCYGRSFYAGAANATTPNAGEVLGILAGPTPGEVHSGMEAALRALEGIGFEDCNGIPCLAHTVSRTGAYLAREAGVREGTALAYLIAPPLESMYALDAAIKAADVTLCKLYAPPSETNFGGGLLQGTQSACQTACAAFRRAVTEVANRPKENQYGTG